MEVMLLFLLIMYIILFVEKVSLERKYEALLKNISGTIRIPIIETGEAIDMEETALGKLYFIDTKYMEIHNDDEYFYKTVEDKRVEYTELIEKYQEIYKCLKAGISIQDIKSDKDLATAAITFFGKTDAIFGTLYNGKIQLNNGRHRYVIAKKMGAGLPVFIEENKMMINSDIFDEKGGVEE